MLCNFFIQSFVDGNFGWFNLLAIVNSAADTWMCVGLCGMRTFGRNPVLISTVTRLVGVPSPAVIKGFIFNISSLSIEHLLSFFSLKVLHLILHVCMHVHMSVSVGVCTGACGCTGLCGDQKHPILWSWSYR